ncbi:hypothetical protein WUBG_14728, partial [Wuchereria bancrofti]
ERLYILYYIPFSVSLFILFARKPRIEEGSGSKSGCDDESGGDGGGGGGDGDDCVRNGGAEAKDGASQQETDEHDDIVSPFTSLCLPPLHPNSSMDNHLPYSGASGLSLL